MSYEAVTTIYGYGQVLQIHAGSRMRISCVQLLSMEHWVQFLLPKGADLGLALRDALSRLHILKDFLYLARESFFRSSM